VNVLAIGAHWDDIEIGCGLSLNRLKKRGAKLFGVVLTNSNYEVVEDAHQRKTQTAISEGNASFKELGICYKPTTRLPNQEMVYSQKVMQELEAIVRDEQIDLVFTHWFGDHNTDHAATWEISRVAFRKVRNVLQYQSNAYFDNVKEFTPHFFWGFSEEDYQLKKNLLAIHETEWEYRKERWEREIFGRERFWGYLCGHDFAEAFMVTRLTDSYVLGLSDIVSGVEDGN